MARKIHLDLSQKRRLLVIGRDVDFWVPPGGVEIPTRPGVVVAVASRAGVSANFEPDTIIQTTDNPQTVINANPNVGHVFQLAAGTHTNTALRDLRASANAQAVQGETDGIPVITEPLDQNGVSLGKTKTLWSQGTPTSIIDGGGTGEHFMVEGGKTGIVLRRLKIQGFTDASSPHRVVGGGSTLGWIIEDSWFVGGKNPIGIGDSMIVRRNRIQDGAIWWCSSFQAVGTASNPIIIEDNEVFDINVAEQGGVVNAVGDPQFDAGFKLAGGPVHVKVRRNYLRNIHGPGIWFDGHGNLLDVGDNILVDCGIHNDGGVTPSIFYEIGPGHGGSLFHNNWVLGHAWINISHCHGDGSSYIEVYENTVDSDIRDRPGINIKDDQHGGGGDLTASHPLINTVGTVNGSHFSDRIRVYINVMRKRDSAFGGTVPVAGMQGGGGDIERNFEFFGNKYEVHSAIANPFMWPTAMNYTTWRAQRAATGDTQNTGPLFDSAASGSEFVVWNGTPQFANTPNNWENA